MCERSDVKGQLMVQRKFMEGDAKGEEEEEQDRIVVAVESWPKRDVISKDVPSHKKDSVLFPEKNKRTSLSKKKY